MAPGEVNNGLFHHRSGFQHGRPIEVTNVVIVKVNGKSLRWAETEVKGCASFQGEDGTEQRVPGKADGDGGDVAMGSGQANQLKSQDYICKNGLFSAL